MNRRICKDCPISNCGSKFLFKLSNHLAQVHELSPEQRKPYLQEARLQKYKVVREYNRTKCDWLIPSENGLYKADDK